MTLNNLIKFNILIFYVISGQELVKGGKTYLSDNTINTNEALQPSVYSRAPQVYFVPHQKYISLSKNSQAVPQLETQIPTAVSSTEETSLSPNYKVVLDDFKVTTSQVTKPPQEGSQANYPYIFTIAKVAPSTPKKYSSISTSGNKDHEKIPQKYRYGYRVSNPHSGTEFGHSEINDGVAARGYYHVLLPDGRLQNVKYWAGPSGYHAIITYETRY